MADFDSALSDPTSPSTVVTNVVYQKLLAKLPVKLKESSKQPVEELREKHWFKWLQKDEILWTIPMSKEQIEEESDYTLVFAAQFLPLGPNLISHQDESSTRHEGLCIIAMIRKMSYEILGYNTWNYHDKWQVHEGEEYVVEVAEVDFSRFPIHFG